MPWRAGVAKSIAAARPGGALELSAMVAIGVILLFVAAFALLNRIEFGRFD